MAVIASKAAIGPISSADRGAPRARERLAAAQGADDRRRGEDPEPGVRRHLDLEDPLPRGPEAARPAAHRRRLPPLQPGRRRAPAGDPAHAARRVPAAAGDPPGARDRETSPGAGPAARARSAAPASVGEAGDQLHPRRPARRGRRRRRSSCASSRTSGSSPAQAARRPRGLRRDRPRDRPRGRRALEVRRRRGATCASSGPRPTARRRCSSSCSAPQLRSRSQARRKEAVENLESLAGGLRPPQASAAGPRPAPAQGDRASSCGAMPRVSRSRRDRSAEPERVWDLVSDPHSLPRWWPRTVRVEDVRGAERRPGALDDGARDRTREPASAPTTAAPVRRAPERYAWEQQIEGTPFERVLRAARLEIGLSARTTRAPR